MMISAAWCVGLHVPMLVALSPRCPDDILLMSPWMEMWIGEEGVVEHDD